MNSWTLIFLALWDKPGGRNRLLQQCYILARQAAPGAEGVEAIVKTVFINQRRQCADFLEAIGWRHLNIAVGAQPAPVVEPVLGDEAHVGRDQIPQPTEDPCGIEVVAVGVAERKIVGADVALRAVGHADAGDVPVPPWPGRTAAGT